MLRALAELSLATYGPLIGVYCLTCWIMGLVFWMKGEPFDKAVEFALTGLVYGFFYFVALFIAQFFAAIACGNFWSICSP